MTVYAPGPTLVAGEDVLGSQYQTDVAALTDGGYVLTWSDGNATVARVFEADGRPRTGEITLASRATDSAVTALADGGFAVVVPDGRDGSASVVLRLFDADGTARTPGAILTQPFGPSGSVLTYAPVAITTLSDGGLAVAWVEGTNSTPNATTLPTVFSTVGQVFSPGGTPRTGPVLLGTPYRTGGGPFFVDDIDLTPTAGGGFAFARTYYAPGSSPSSAYGGAEAQFFGPDAQAVSPTVTIATTPAAVSLATLPDGQVVVAGGALRTLNPDGTAGPARYLEGQRGPVEIAALPDGNLVVTYLRTSGSPVGPYSLPTGPNERVAAIYRPDGTEVGQLTQNSQLTQPAVLADGRIVLAGTAGGPPSPVSSLVLSPVAPTADADGLPLVNDADYLARYPDVAAAGQDPEQHYRDYGWHEGRDPDPLFSTNGYLAAYGDVRAAGIDPLQHYDLYGWRDGRDPSAAFDTQGYLARNPDVRAAGIDPLAHYLQDGRAEGRAITPAIGTAISDDGFDAAYYLLANADVAAAALVNGTDTYGYARSHYDQYGWREGRDPNAYFDTSAYLAAYADVRAAGIDPLQHYDRTGWRQGRDPSAVFDTSNYLTAYGDVAAAGQDPLVHFLRYGAGEGRQPLGDGIIG